MSEIRVTCRNEEEVVKVLEIAEKEGYAWSNNAKATSYRPNTRYPYCIVICKVLSWDVERGGKACTAQNFINSYNTDHTEPCEVSQKVKNEIILDFIKKWREIRMGCAARSCMNCKFLKNVANGAYCWLDDVGNTNNAISLDATKLLLDVVASGDPCTWKLTPDEVIEVLEEEIKKLKDMKDTDVYKRVAALKTAVRALEEKENGFRTKGD